MPENLQDKLISDYVYKEYDIAYPVIITRWEIMQVNGLDKRYLKVYFQKISDTVKAFKFNVKCYSDFGEVENLSDISLLEVDKIDLEFFKVVPLKSEVNRVEINIYQCLLIDNSMVEPKGKQMVVNTFKPFKKDDLETGKRLLPNAKGYPIDNLTHWYCACGTLHSSIMQKCGKCNKSKKEIFSTLTPDRMQEENAKIQKDEQANSKKDKRKIIILACITFVALLFTMIPNIVYTVLFPKFYIQFGDYSDFLQCMTLLIIMSSVLLIANAIGLIFKGKILKIIELIAIIACLIINIISVVISIEFGVHTVGNYKDYGDLLMFCFALSILNVPLAVTYFLCNNEKVFDKIYKLFKVKKYKN